MRLAAATHQHTRAASAGAATARLLTTFLLAFYAWGVWLLSSLYSTIPVKSSLVGQPDKRVRVLFGERRGRKYDSLFKMATRI